MKEFKGFFLKRKEFFMANFDFHERHCGKIVILDLAGKVIFGDGTVELHRVIRELVEKGEKKILLNFAGVDYVDSSGLGELVGGLVAAKKIGGDIKLSNVPQNVLELLVLTRLSTVFEIFDIEDEACKSFAKISLQSAGIGIAGS
jgi:anti-anti-sigma factor